MIPKIIHYCWFGRNPIPKEAEECINSWKKLMPDYEIVQWNEENYDVNKNKFIKEAYSAGKWSFVSDYARLDIIYNNGGIYFDTDVKAIRKFDDLLIENAFMGFEDKTYISTGLGFGAEKGCVGIKKILELYDNINFIKEDGNYNYVNCPIITTDLLKRYGLQQNDKFQNVIGISIYPTEYFGAMNYTTGIANSTNNTYSIHLYSMSWVDDFEKKWKIREQKLCKIMNYNLARKIIRILNLPERVYRKVKKKIK